MIATAVNVATISVKFVFLNCHCYGIQVHENSSICVHDIFIVERALFIDTKI